MSVGLLSVLAARLKSVTLDKADGAGRAPRDRIDPTQRALVELTHAVGLLPVTSGSREELVADASLEGNIH